MLETPDPRKFSVEGESGYEDVDQPGGHTDRGGDRGGGEGGAAAVHGCREAAGQTAGAAEEEARESAVLRWAQPGLGVVSGRSRRRSQMLRTVKSEIPRSRWWLAVIAVVSLC